MDVNVLHELLKAILIDSVRVLRFVEQKKRKHDFRSQIRYPQVWNTLTDVLYVSMYTLYNSWSFTRK